MTLLLETGKKLQGKTSRLASFFASLPSLIEEQNILLTSLFLYGILYLNKR